jgi:hypothetical protein
MMAQYDLKCYDWVWKIIDEKEFSIVATQHSVYLSEEDDYGPLMSTYFLYFTEKRDEYMKTYIKKMIHDAIALPWGKRK